MNRMIIGSVVAFLGAAGACRNEPPARPPEVPPAPSSSSIAPGASLGVPVAPEVEGRAALAASTTGVDHVGQVTVTPGESTEAASATKLTDDQILYVLHAANLGEMEQARLAQKKADDARVKRFAAMMLEDHGNADAKGNDVAKKTHASLAPSDPSHRLENDAKAFSAGMKARRGSDFDRSYIDAQVKEHHAVLEAIDRELLPAVRSAEVKDLIQAVRAKVEGHLAEAEQIQKGLGG